MRTTQRLACASVAALSINCVASDTPWRTERRQLGDTTIVRTPPVDSAHAVLPVHEDLSIGQIEGDDAYMLGQVTLLAVARDGSIIAYDRQVPALRMYDASGSFIRTVGGPGSGPGEFRAAHGLAVAPDGRILLYDPANARVNFYDASGEPAGEWRFVSAVPPLVMGAFVANALFVDSAGAVYVTTAAGPPPADGSWQFVPVRLGTDGTAMDTIWPPDYGYERPLLVAESAGRRAMMAPPYTPVALWTITASGGFATAFSRDYRIDILQADGTALRIEKNDSPVRIGEEERQHRQDEAVERMRRIDPGWRWSGADFPQHKPVLQRVQGAPDGRIWAQLHQPSIRQEHMPSTPGPDARTVVTWQEREVYDVFEPDGDYAGRVYVPENATFMFMRGEYAWGIARDSLDVQSIRRYRLGER